MTGTTNPPRLQRDVVHRRELVAGVLKEVIGGERFAGGRLDQVWRGVPGAVAVDAVGEPLVDRLELARPHEGVDVQILTHRGVDLGGQHRPQRVGGEVAEGAVTPVDVLETALAVGVGPHAQIVVVLLVPHAGHVLDGEVASDQVTLDLEAGDDVHVVGEFVGFHPDEVRRVHAVGGRERLLRRERDIEVILRVVGEAVPERPRAADVVLPEPGL